MTDPQHSTETQAPQAEADRPWHAIEVDEALEALGTGAAGLDAAEAGARLVRYGPNRLPAPAPRSALARLAAQFANPLIYVLVLAAALTAAMGHWLDTGVILAVVAVNTGIGYVQEGKAERALLAIREMLAPHATVMREGRRQEVAADVLVPGDIVVLDAGDRVPADIRLVEVRALQIDEAALTGESVPVRKAREPTPAGAPLGDRTAIAHAGTLVTGGQGSGVVAATGAQSEIGRISAMLKEVEQTKTPLLRQFDRFARLLTGVILVVAAAMYVFGVTLRGYGAAEMFMVVVGLAVAAIPEGLPAILTVTLAIGVQRMAGRRAIIRRLPAVETLGAVSVICSDKTGTLTRNEMSVRVVATAGADYEATGTGYAPEGEIRREGSAVAVEDAPVLRELVRAGLSCNDAALRGEAGEWTVSGDPMEGALVALAARAGLDGPGEREALPRVDAIPFDAAHRYMATLHGDGTVYVKGAPERILDMARHEATPEGARPLDRAAWDRRIAEIAAGGHRVLALATRPADGGRDALAPEDVESGLTLLGLVGLIDPPRAEAVTAIGECQRAGIRVKMITGDHMGTAQAIAAQLGLANSDEALTGADLEAMDEEALRAAALRVDVFARAAPAHKLRLVEAMQADGLVVAMTGDGVNDAPALKRADIGVAMGRKGTEAAKEASEMVLADDNFATIAAAVKEGRTVYDNLRKAITFILPTNGGESGAILIAVLFGLTLPLTPLQILWINMVSSVVLAMALAFEPPEPDVMDRPPRPARRPMLTGFIVWRVSFVSLLFLAGTYGMFALATAQGAPVEEARTAVVNAIVAMEVFYLFSVRYLRTPAITWQGILGTPRVLAAISAVFVLQLFFTYAPVMGDLFETRPLDFGTGLQVVAIGVCVLLAVEIEKSIRRMVARG